MKTIKSIALLSVVAIVLLMFSSCGGNAKNKEEHGDEEGNASEELVLLSKQQREAINLQLGSVEDRNLTSVIKTNGQLEVAPDEKADITAFIGGNVKEIKVFHGERVSKGQVLATLEHPDYISIQEDFAQAASRMEFLKKEYERQKELFEKEVGAGRDFQQVKSEYSSIKTKYNGLMVRLKMMNIDASAVEAGRIFKTIAVKSPISGYVNQVNVKVGSYIDGQTKMFSVSNNNAIHADFLVYEKDINRLKIGQTVTFTVSNRADRELSAKIFAIGKEFQEDARALLVHARIDGAPKDLVSGVYVSGSINTDKITAKSLPEEAVVTEGTKSYIFVYDDKATKLAEQEEKSHDEENKSKEEKGAERKHAEDVWAFRKVEVAIGAVDGKYVEVKPIGELSPNAKVVLNAAYYLLADSKKKETKHEH